MLHTIAVIATTDRFRMRRLSPNIEIVASIAAAFCVEFSEPNAVRSSDGRSAWMHDERGFAVTKDQLPVLSHEEDPDDSHHKETALLDEETLYGAEPLTAQRPCLMVVSGKRSLGRIFKLRDGMAIGRALGADILLEERGVSRRHAKVTVLPDLSVLITDLGSSNGLVFKRARVREQLLVDGDRIQLGDAVLMLLRMDDIDETMQRNLFESAAIDPATQLPSRRYFQDVLAKEFTYSTRFGVPLTVVFLCIDQYLEICDGHGKAEGDRALARLARSIGEVVRADGTVVARHSEEELALLIPEIPRDASRNCAEWIRRAAEAHGFRIGEQRLRMTVSGGLARSDDENITTVQELVESAHEGLYRAKMRGKNRIECSWIND